MPIWFVLGILLIFSTVVLVEMTRKRERDRNLRMLSQPSAPHPVSLGQSPPQGTRVPRRVSATAPTTAYQSIGSRRASAVAPVIIDPAEDVVQSVAVASLIDEMTYHVTSHHETHHEGSSDSHHHDSHHHDSSWPDSSSLHDSSWPDSNDGGGFANEGDNDFF